MASFEAGGPRRAVALDNRDRLFDAELASGADSCGGRVGTPYGWFENPGGFWTGPVASSATTCPSRRSVRTRSRCSTTVLGTDVIADLRHAGAVDDT